MTQLTAPTTRLPRIAFATADLARLGIEYEDEDRPHLEAAFSGRAEIVFARWDDRAVRWNDFDLVALRSTWDYARRLSEFLAWVDATAQTTRLLNDPATVRWNSDKTYLGELRRAGVPVVPTEYVTTLDGAREAMARQAADGEVVVKPSVSAGSHLTGRFAPDDPAALDLAGLILAAGKATMIQPFVPSVAERGEVAVIFLGGEPSHAVRKGPLLARGGGLLTGEYVEDLSPVELDGRYLEAAARVLKGYATYGPGRALLYARIDLVETDDGSLELLELELIEPSLFLPYAPGSAARFADAVLARTRSA